MTQTSTIYPTQLERIGESGLRILWSDGKSREYTVSELRDKCPCATCRERRKMPQPESLLPVLTAEEAKPLALMGMKPVGNYAYSIEFSDGHDTGIYTFESLLGMGTSVSEN